MTFDPSKPYAANHGRPVRILASDVKGDRPIAAAHTDEDGRELRILHYRDGSYTEGKTPYDLYNVPERVVRKHHVRLSETGFGAAVELLCSPPNVRFTFEGDKLVAVGLIGETQ